MSTVSALFYTFIISTVFFGLAAADLAGKKPSIYSIWSGWFFTALKWIYYISYVGSVIYCFNVYNNSFSTHFVYTFVFCFFILFCGAIYICSAALGGGGGSVSSSSSRSSNYDDNATIDYKPQRLEGIGWANCGVGDTSTGGKYACQDIDRMKRSNPQYSYRVVERRNGKIVGTIYSC